MSNTASLRPGDTIGILGGGQLGRMLALAAAPLGLKAHIFCPDPGSPAFDVSHACTIASYDDEDALNRFADSVSVVTYEFENVPGPTAAHLDGRVPVRPGPGALEVSQDRLTEKIFLKEAGVALAGFARIDSQADLDASINDFGGTGVLKTRRFGYDGKGQIMIRSSADAQGAYEKLGSVPLVLEALVPFQSEISVIVARGLDGTCSAYDPVENHHEHHILKTSTVPAIINPETAKRATEMAVRIASALSYVGVMGVEMFLVADESGERILVNEIAPRVHNSGHWTQDACVCSQFDQHIRAIAGWPLGSSERHSNVVMENLIGDEADRWPDILKESSARLHLYGKTEARPGRKMGHVNRISPKSA